MCNRYGGLMTEDDDGHAEYAGPKWLDRERHSESIHEEVQRQEPERKENLDGRAMSHQRP